MRTAGDVGAFVDETASLYAVLYNRNPLDGLAPWTSGRLDHGRWFWHVKTRDDGEDPYSGEMSSWQPIKTLVVRDEPPVIEGWLVRARRLRSAGRKCRRYAIGGTVRFDDNDPTSASVRYELRLTASGRTVARLRGALPPYASSVSGSICTRATNVRAVLLLVDQAGGAARSEPRTMSLR